mmetsp:Transcript_6531/g.7465  ORF Transcript_6531/g.7465 Transcript_6531/m.7465 type:complete len:320 (+) Transcript_6531:93-1052(+)|eukprot:CAMPEP_0194145442 /NCGR_PEP_ID=MMETSP0152-20130528/17431_1 /TAXON_ID=1049557 /ORGANISM="Thalassiothrix antarctica, Strain L6-D1" /LENGTH=319 /DNA_ID=CAMNT_0038845683 /DNA_START=75 /DNA_END=1034 /DNA_ORIENTATION=-
MSDAAAFFASKKKSKKKAFKFNANKVDAATVTTTVHVDAPALSTDAEAISVGATLASTSIAENDSNQNTNNTKSNVGTADGPSSSAGGQWDDEALAASYSRKGLNAVVSTAEVLDMKAFDAKRRDQDDIAERMRVEETKAQLAAAREGMEREAQRLKQEREKKQEESKKPDVPRSGGGLGGFGGGSKWVPPHMRAGGGLTRVRMGSNLPAALKKLDTQDADLFPDLALAEKILEQQRGQENVAYKVQKKTPVGGGATWGSRPPIVRPKQAPETKTKPPEPELKVYAPPTPTPQPTSVVEKKKPTKKKKKDLSTFKPSSS